MVKYEELRDLWRKRPFEPFRIHLADGRSYTIEFPEINVVTRTYMAVGIPIPNDPDPLMDRRVYVPMEAIDRVEVLDYPSPWHPRW